MGRDSRAICGPDWTADTALLEALFGCNAAHSLGSDFVFPVSKSVWLLALVGGEERLLDANRVAFANTMAWSEESLAVMRKRFGTVLPTVPTGNS